MEEKASACSVSGGKFGVGEAAVAAHSVAPNICIGFGNVGRGTSCSASHTACIDELLPGCHHGVPPSPWKLRKHGISEEASTLKPITIIIIVMVQS